MDKKCSDDTGRWTKDDRQQTYRKCCIFGLFDSQNVSLSELVIFKPNEYFSDTIRACKSNIVTQGQLGMTSLAKQDSRLLHVSCHKQIRLQSVILSIVSSVDADGCHKVRRNLFFFIMWTFSESYEMYMKYKCDVRCSGNPEKYVKTFINILLSVFRKVCNLFLLFYCIFHHKVTWKMGSLYNKALKQICSSYW